ncbi:hypothetical protein Lalb_Chr21g0309401 [Lupinus albus]|uniref:DUF789 family protein n=1 Tax=Lupinus albus TaxID=3870 RepID=A0A6A4N5I0_LUPAL|nr:hypothetical protein Lalb_Chr21g0309401 [Lupinus albus]
MSNSNGFVPSRIQPSNRFYCPPPVRKNQKQQQQQQQLHRPLNSDTRTGLAQPDTRTGSDDSTLLRPNSVASPSPPTTPDSTNFDRILDSFTPFVPAQFSNEHGMKGHRTLHHSNADSSFSLEDLWELFTESGAYGVEVPLIVNGSDPIQQYYVPYLSAIQLYEEEKRIDESSKEAASIDIYSQKLSRLNLREGTTMSSSTYETEVCNSPGQLVYEYFEGALPHLRPPLHIKVSALASEFPNLKKYRSSDLSPSSWFSVAWYPIYRIPVGATLKSLDASFLTFHLLSTNSRSRNQLHRASSGRKVQGVHRSLNRSLPIFGLASCKYKGSVLSPDGASEWEQVNALLQAAADWLQSLQAKHPDYEYFVSRISQWR